MDKRTFLKTAGTLAAGVIASPSLSAITNVNDAFTLPPLGYSFNALEPHIDALTMEIHHDKHHGAYVTNLNKAMASAPSDLLGLSLVQLCMVVKPDQTAIVNNAGGHYNHSKFWNWIKPGGASAPTGALLSAIVSAFGSIEGMKKQMEDAAKARFGSGWAWLIKDGSGKLSIISTPNQVNPLMGNITDQLGTPVLGIDVWEHAYYLKYQNRRADYLQAFWNVVNWDEVAADYDRL
jgi:Fe-Mn family superoxide dismutase